MLKVKYPLDGYLTVHSMHYRPNNVKLFFLSDNEEKNCVELKAWVNKLQVMYTLRM